MRVKLLSLLIFKAAFYLTPNAFSQITAVDSNGAMSIVSDSKPAQIDALIELARARGDFDYKLSLQYTNKALKLAETCGDSLRLVKASRIKSQLLRRIGEVDSAITIFKSILNIAKRHNYSDEVKIIVNALGVAFMVKSNYDKALACFFESLQLRERDGDKFEISVALSNIGSIYHELKDYSTALKYFEKSFAIKQTIKNKKDLDVLMVNMSVCYLYLNNLSKARWLVNQGFLACGSHCTSTFLIVAKQSLGQIYLKEKKIEEAENQFLHAYEMSIKAGNERYHLDNIEFLLSIYIGRNDFRSAEKYIKEAEKLITSQTPYNQGVIQVFMQTAFHYLNIGDLKKGSYYLQKYSSLKDSTFNERLTTNLMKIEADHLEKENKAKIEAQNKILALNEEVILRQRYLNVFVGIVALLLVIITSMLVKRNRQKQRINSLLDKKVRERTQQLEANRDELERACEERDVLIHKTSMDIRNALATIKGLCGVALKDVQDPAALQYMAKVDAVSDTFSVTLSRLQLSKSSDFS